MRTHTLRAAPDPISDQRSKGPGSGPGRRSADARHTLPLSPLEGEISPAGDRGGCQRPGRHGSSQLAEALHPPLSASPTSPPQGGRGVQTAFPHPLLSSPRKRGPGRLHRLRLCTIPRPGSPGSRLALRLAGMTPGGNSASDLKKTGPGSGPGRRSDCVCHTLPLSPLEGEMSPAGDKGGWQRPGRHGSSQLAEALHTPLSALLTSPPQGGRGVRAARPDRTQDAYKRQKVSCFQHPAAGDAIQPGANGAAP